MVAPIACVLVTAACYSSAAPVSNTHTRVLFVGNSLTYYHDLPRTFAAIAASAGDSVHVTMAAAPNLALIDHLNGGSNVMELLRKERWDFVVLQQGPTTEPIGKDSLIIWTQLFAPHIRAAGAVPVLFMVWPLHARWDRMPLVRDSYDAAARSVNGVFAPAGDAWTAAHKASSSVELYGDDDFHPTPTGTYLAALTIYGAISGKDPRTLPARVVIGGIDMNIPESETRLLQRASYSAISRSPAN